MEKSKTAQELSNVFVQADSKQVQILKDIILKEISENGTIKVINKFGAIEYYNFWGEQCFAPDLTAEEKLWEIRGDFTRILCLTKEDYNDKDFANLAMYYFSDNCQDHIYRMIYKADNSNITPEQIREEGLSLFTIFPNIIEEKLTTVMSRNQKSDEDERP